MLYNIVLPLVRLGFKLLLKNVYISGEENIPVDKPVLLVSNHPTAFLEPCILACFLKFPLYFFVSGRYFNNKFLAKIFHGFHMLPIYNREDGMSNLRDSHAKMELYQQTIAQKIPLLIYAESSTMQLRYMRPMKRGFIRLGYKAMESHQLEDLYLVPVGCNYRQAEQKRTRVYIDIEKPLNLKDYKASFQTNAAKATNQVLEKFTQMMDQVVVSPKDRKADALYEKLLVLIDNEIDQPVFPFFSKSKAYLLLCKRFIEKINKLDEALLQTKEQEITTYLQMLETKRITDMTVANDFNYGFGQKMASALGFLPAWIGKLAFWPLQIIHKKTQKEVKRKEFRLSMFFAASLGYLCLTVIVSTLLILFFPVPNFVLFIIFIFIFGLFSIYYFDQTNEWSSLNKASQLDETTKLDLKKTRKNILEFYYNRSN